MRTPNRSPQRPQSRRSPPRLAQPQPTYPQAPPNVRPPPPVPPPNALATALTQIATLLQHQQQGGGRKPVVNKPKDFDGDKELYEKWKMEMRLFLADHQINDDNRRSNIIVSYLRGPKVDAFVRILYNNSCVGGIWQMSSVRLWAILDEHYIDASLREKAQQKIEYIRQGNRSADDYIVEFEDLASQAGYTLSDEHVIRLLKRGTSQNVVDQVYMSGNIPTTYVEWCTRIRGIDRNWRIRQEEKALWSRHHGNSNASGSRPATQPARQAAPAAPQRTPGVIPVAGVSYTPRRDGTGTLYQGGGQPMQVDRACIKCGHKKSQKGTCGDTWHLPNRPAGPQPQRVRELAVETEAEAGTENPTTVNLDNEDQGLNYLRSLYASKPELFAKAGFRFGNN